MTKATIWKSLPAGMKTALRGSARKWIKIIFGKNRDEADTNCPLCQATTWCEDCPVDAWTRSGCLGSPYARWVDHQRMEHTELSPYEICCSRCLTLAKAELRFLAGFLPKSDKLQVQVAKALKAKWADIKGRKK